jgi:hypothetical protein
MVIGFARRMPRAADTCQDRKLLRAFEQLRNETAELHATDNLLTICEFTDCSATDSGSRPSAQSTTIKVSGCGCLRRFQDEFNARTQPGSAPQIDISARFSSSLDESRPDPMNLNVDDAGKCSCARRQSSSMFLHFARRGDERAWQVCGSGPDFFIHFAGGRRPSPALHPSAREGISLAFLRKADLLLV